MYRVHSLVLCTTEYTSLDESILGYNGGNSDILFMKLELASNNHKNDDRLDKIGMLRIKLETLFISHHFNWWTNNGAD